MNKINNINYEVMIEAIASNKSIEDVSYLLGISFNTYHRYKRDNSIYGKLFRDAIDTGKKIREERAIARLNKAGGLK